MRISTKRIISLLVVLAMALAVVPAVSFATEDTTYKAVRAAYFNNASEWKATDGDNILIASGGSDGWQADSSFTDDDGTVTSQTSLSGTGFASPRNALVAFTIPEDFDPEKTVRITLGFTVKNVKQVTSGVRVAVYGNSLDGEWSVSGNTKSDFGEKSDLTLLGLTTAIQTGNQTGETASGETITLTSQKLTQYVKDMASEGKTEVTFRLATPLGGIRIYDASQTNAPTLTIGKGEYGSVEIDTVYYDTDGETVLDTDSKTVEKLVAGETYDYSSSIDTPLTVNGSIYTYDAEKSALTTTVTTDGANKIVIAYVKWDGTSSDGYELTDEGAWCWFADPRSIAYKNDEGTLDFTIIGYIDVHGNIKATQVDNLTNTTEEILIRSNIQPDDHNNPSFLVLPDERVLVIYSRHTDEPCFWYRVTKEPGDLTTLGDEYCLKTANNTTYPSPFLLSSDPEHLYLCWRGINWHPTFAQLSIPDENGEMEFTFGPYQMVQSTGARPYAKYTSNGVDKLYVTYTTGHPDNEQPNWLYFNQIDVTKINTEGKLEIEDINGNVKATISASSTTPLAVNKTDSSQTYIVDTAPGNLRDWVWQTAIDPDGNPVIAMVRISGGKTSHDYYYVKWNGTEWVKTFLANGGGAFHQTSGTEMCYSGGMAIDPDNTNVIYCSVPIEGAYGSVYEIVKYTMSDDGTQVLSTEQMTENSAKNNVRPFVIPNSEGNELRLMWMQGDYYYWMVKTAFPQGYPTAIRTEVELPKSEVDISTPVLDEEFEDNGGEYVSQSGAEASIEAAASDKFTVSAYVQLSEAGDVLDMGSFSFAIENRDTQYGATHTGTRKRAVTTVNGKEYVSSNVYGNSDSWALYSTGTNGDYYVSDYEGCVNLTFVYDGEKLKVYRDGLLDQSIEAAGLTVDNITIGGADAFDGYVSDVKLFDKALNSDEVNALAEAEYELTEREPKGGKTVTVNCVDYDGAVIATESIALEKGATTYFYTPETSIVEGAYAYLYRGGEEKIAVDLTAGEPALTVEYRKCENLVTDGSFKDADGSFSWGTWASAKNNEAFATTCEDWFYKVNRETNDAVLYKTGTITADDYALGTRWNDGEDSTGSGNGLCSMVNFIKVEAGKTYYVSYDYKNRTDGASGSYIRTTFQKTNEITTDDGEDNNIPTSVTTEWNTNAFAITAPEDGYIYFHFSYLGGSGNAGTGPYWYFDNFIVTELVSEVITVEAQTTDETGTAVTLKNDTGRNLTNVKVYAVNVSEDGVEDSVDAESISMERDAEATVNLKTTGSNVKVYVWNDKMQPLN